MSIDNDADALAEIVRHEITHALDGLNSTRLAGLAGCHAPESDTSPGGRFLTAIRDAVTEDITPDGTLDDTVAGQIADSAPCPAIHRMWQEFVDLRAYREDFQPCDDGFQHAGDSLAHIAERLVTALVAQAAGIAAALTDHAPAVPHPHGAGILDAPNATGQASKMSAE